MNAPSAPTVTMLLLIPLIAWRVYARNRGPVGYSIGVAIFRSPAASVDEAIRRADALMYQVKNVGKNDVLFEEYADASGTARAGAAAG